MEKYERFLCDGVEVLHVRISLPHELRSDAIRAFFEQIGENAYAFCKNELLPHAENAYHAQEDPRRQMRYRPFRYRLRGTVCYENEKLLSVWIEASLLREGEAARSFCDAQNFSKEDGFLLSAQDALSLYTGMSPMKTWNKNIQNLLFRDRDVRMLCDGVWQPFNEFQETKK